MDCHRVRQLLPGYLDGALPSGAGSETHLMVGHHLERCGECREELQQYLELSVLMSRMQRPAPPAHSRIHGTEEYPRTVGSARDRRPHCSANRICCGLSGTRNWHAAWCR